MDCEESVALLSELHANALEETTALSVKKHLADCPPCCGIFDDIQTIIMTATSLRQAGDGLEAPVEDRVWQRLTLVRRTVH